MASKASGLAVSESLFNARVILRHYSAKIGRERVRPVRSLSMLMTLEASGS